MKTLTNLISIQLIVALLCNALMAQTPQYYNYNTNGNNNSFPFNIDTGKEVQLLYLPGAFNQPTPAPAGSLTSIYFRIGDAYPLGPTTYTDFTIKLGQSSITSFAPGSFYSGPMDTVYYRASISLTGLAGQWMSITFDTPFAYDPLQSLIAEISQCSAPGATGFSMCNTSLSGNLRNYSVGGCPLSYAGQDYSSYHIGFDICNPPSAPTNTTPPQNQTICSGYTTTLSASGVGTLGWYDAPTGGNWLGSGTTYITTNLVTPATFYVQDSTCTTSISRTSILVNVHFGYNFTETHSICNGDSLLWQGSYRKTAGLHTANYLTVNGCDSIYSLTLNLNPVYTYTSTQAICSGDSLLWQGSYRKTAGLHSANYTTINGCDSTYALTLNLNPVYTINESHSICKHDTYNWQGTDYTTAGTYTAPYTSISGCDSIYTLNLTVDSVDLGVTQFGPLLTADSIANTYQWIDCNNGFQPINGATSQSYTASSNGDYAVIINQGLCTDTSACFQVTGIGIQEPEREILRLFPNPSDGAFTIMLDESSTIEIYNALGSLIYNKTFEKGKHALSLNVADGVYMMRACNDKGIRSLRMVVQK